ncbi:molybdopterin-guanine dinucleotide biosynthesis protein MobB [Salicibibacter cibarius]|uniref:Molybdopterin-guanine dinucleotide biosynthesis protein MobB n=1 Tax=Salicibibacter cibarius TaxID=2743000 RepID=A0A7T6Z0I3_9BACI|nr:molybdopterin-guanine dinucleotide biosynthesis protein MobB [Salicibibacter cibarius]
MGQQCRVLQVVGYKNSGKTTLMEELVKAFSAREMHVAALKHHGHGGGRPPRNLQRIANVFPGQVLVSPRSRGMVFYGCPRCKMDGHWSNYCVFRWDLDLM